MKSDGFISRLYMIVVMALLLAAAVSASGMAGKVKETLDFGEKWQTDWKLRVSSCGRFLIHSDGRPFFYMGDTAWELFHRLDRRQADMYLSNRAAKGFNVIQAVALAEISGLDTPNACGHLPLKKTNGRWDPNSPDVKTGPANDYWDHVDWIINKAAEKGLYIGLLPTWGDKWNLKSWGKGPVVFTPANALNYGKWLGTRYRNQPNIIWILGGDRNPEEGRHYEIVRQMAKGIRDGDGGKHLITYHPTPPKSSSSFFHQDRWLDFNMFQSGHGARDLPNYNITTADYNLSPTKPVIDGEPCYEDHPVNWHRRGQTGWFNDFDVRQAGYWSVLSGACGHTYGNNNIWQMYRQGRQGIGLARTAWYEAMHHPGSYQMGYMKKLFLSRPFLKLRPDQFLIAGDTGSGGMHIRAAIGGDYAIVYLPYGQPVTVRTQNISGNRLTAWWFDPRTAMAVLIGEFENAPEREFDPPGQPERGNDWVLVIDDAARCYPAPGLYR